MKQFVVRDATAADAPAIAGIGSVGFMAVHEEIAGAVFAAAVVEQTYSIDALTDCISRCAGAADAAFLVAEDEGRVLGFLHYDSFGAEPELHRMYVDLERKRAGVGTALIRALHSRLDSGASYVLLVAQANQGARAFYAQHGLQFAARVDGNRYYQGVMGVELTQPVASAPGLLMRYVNQPS